MRDAVAAGAVLLALVLIREILRFANESRESEPRRAAPPDEPDLPPTHTRTLR